MRPGQILTALADLAPAPGERVLDVTRGGQPLVWLTEPERAPRSRAVDRLAALDALRREERILRRGWGFVLGSVTVDGIRRRVRLPLLTQPVRLERGIGRYRVVPAGDLQLTPLVADPTVAGGLEAVPGLGRPGWLKSTGSAAWLRATAAAAGLELADVLATVPRPIPEDRLVAVAVAALFVAGDVSPAGLRDTLLSWAARPGLDATALAAVYGATAAPTITPVDGGPVLSPLPLTGAQRQVVRRARTEPVVVVSGPPGSGKSHAVVAAAMDVVDRGGSVLIATASPHAAEVLGDMLARFPGPVPVLFGDVERRTAIATELGGGTTAGAGEAQLRADEQAVRAARARVEAIRAGIVSALDMERRAAEVASWEPLIPALSAQAPAAFAPGTDLRRVRALLSAAAAPPAGWVSRWRQRWACHRLYRTLGAAPSVPLDRIAAAVDAAAARQAAARLAAGTGTDLEAAWDALWQAQTALAEALGTAMRHRAASERRWRGDARRSVSALAAALRAGRNRRREMLAALDGRALVRALPLWVGTVTDVEDLLPPTPGLFDLVVLDEAAHIDQIRAAPVLARARRALVVGDPRQLRFVSFVSDVDVSTALERHGLTAAADRLDVRRLSAFDVAAGAAPVTWLGEHFRSAPHLIEFSAERFYGGRIALVTRHPRTECVDAIDVVRVDGTVEDGVNHAEVAAVVDVVRHLAATVGPDTAGGRGVASIGVVTPFRAQADALEAALLAAFPAEDIERLGLRSGTVHAFQGSEADIVVVSLGLVDDDSPARVRFVADPNLFNVMVTRARQRMVVVTSLTSPQGVVGEYLAHAQRPPTGADSPAFPPATPATADWRARLGAELRRAGLAVRVDYPVGSWLVDLCVGDGDAAVGLICRVHPDGVEAHLERQETLRRAGWRLMDAFPSRWADDPVRAALDIASALRAPVAP
jgi:hypothetical protein